MKRWHLFLILGYIIIPILIIKLLNIVLPLDGSYIEIFGIKITIILYIFFSMVCSVPVLAFANLLEEMWCKIFKTTNYYDNI